MIELLLILGFWGLELQETGPAYCQLQAVFGEPEFSPAGPGYRVGLVEMANRGPCGFPDLPSQDFLVGLPPEGPVRLEYRALREETFSMVVAPVPFQSFELPARYEPDSTIYAQDGFYPAEPVWIEDISWLRDLRVARIRVAPVQYNPKQGLVRFLKGLSIRVDFSAQAKGVEQGDIFDRLLARMIKNYAQARGFRSPIPQGYGLNSFERFFDWVKLTIDSTGLYKVTYEDLKALGFNPELINPKEVHLFARGDVKPNGPYPETMPEVACYIYGAGDGRFDPDDYILFYGLGSSWFDPEANQFHPNLYTRHSYYWLTWEGGPGQRITKIQYPEEPSIMLDRSESLLHLETDRLNTGRAGLLWTWLELKPGVPAEVPLEIANAESLIDISFCFYPLTAQNQLLVYLNSQLVDEIQFAAATGADNPIPDSIEISFGKALKPSGNRLRFEVVGSDPSAIFLDWMRCRVVQSFSLKEGALSIHLSEPGDYRLRVSDVRKSPLILEVKDPYCPVFLTGFELQGDSLLLNLSVKDYGLYYLTDLGKVAKPSKIERRDPGKLRSPNWSSEYIIVAPDEFYDAARLLERYRAKGVSVRTARLSEIYDDYSFGYEEPGAIKAFFADKRPRYGLFYADGSYDYREILGPSPFPYIPPYEIGGSLDPNVYSKAARAQDSWYADFDGEGGTPDMVLSRVCARSPKEIRDYLDKLKGYEGAGGGWAQRFILAADDMFLGQPSDPDAGAQHIRDCEAIASEIEPALIPVKIYLSEYPYLGTTPATGLNAKPEAKADLIRELNRGALGFAFFGHGRGDLLAHEDLFNIHDVGGLENGPKEPICFFGSCGVGRFEDTRSECISEELIRGRSGAIATVGATKGTSSGSNLAFARELYSALLDTTIATVGEAFYTAWTKDPTHHLFGDPLLVSLASRELGKLKLEPETLKLGGKVKAHALTKISPGQFAVIARGPEFERIYEWTYGTKHYETSYRLPGVELYQGRGEVRADSLSFSFYLPKELPLDTITGPSWAPGLIIPLPQTALVSAYLWGRGGREVFYQRFIPLDTIPEISDDTTGPEISLYADGRPLLDRASVPTSFTLEGRLFDPSGILSSRPPPSGALAGQFKELGLDLGDRWCPLDDYFKYDLGSFTSGSFAYPMTLTDSARIKVYAYDNLLNEGIREVLLRTAKVERLAIRNPLVWPNPTSSRAYFTFELSGPAWVELKIYSIAGRLIRDFPSHLFDRGYQQIEWDGLDQDGSPLANGVYLYRLSAQYSPELGQKEEDELVEKFLIMR